MRRDWVRRRAGLLAGAAVAVIDRRRSRELRRGRKRRRRRVAAGTVLVLWPLAPSLSCSERGAAVSSCAGPECCCSCGCCCCVSLSLSVITFRRNDEGAQEVERARAGEEGGAEAREGGRYEIFNIYRLRPKIRKVTKETITMEERNLLLRVCIFHRSYCFLLTVESFQEVPYPYLAPKLSATYCTAYTQPLYI